MINIGDCIKVTKINGHPDGSADVEFEYTKDFIGLYKAATGKKRAHKKGLKKYLNKMLADTAKTWKKGGAIPCVIPVKKDIEEKEKT
ncbi:hypothetical protein CMI37_22100 [Candidatus Pacearchaeota archaeon]|nr:hypothetical protein [Candidatus Pacearchaeota archaeon]|tara:strand:- start:3093 stop:3353 length:261 start_codon:yes stop_codon:yes gene_type:complete